MASVHKNNANRSHHTRLTKAMRGVMAHQTNEKQASANEQTRQRMALILAPEQPRQWRNVHPRIAGGMGPRGPKA
ncbi:hypothetical protein TNCV_4326771 [Trichonephila clavipes]|nr:hypothetical protein TNCV_4326771 [Trichonephila clavipes]